MMKTILPFPGVARAISFFFCLAVFAAGVSAQDYKGRDGNAVYNITGTFILNRYSALASSAAAGSLSLTVADINELSGSYSFTNAVNPYQQAAIGKGDLIMIIQVQGADIITTDDAQYGQITNYNGTGRYEFRTVYEVSGNTILLCENLTNSYTQSGRSRAQVVRVPRLNQLTVAAGAVITGRAWDGARGGIVALEANDAVLINGQISANAIGFRGGIDDKNSSSASGNTINAIYRTTLTTTAGGKGESIAGNANDYLSLLNGANGRGAPANGGGGGNGHNSGGGGGSNANASGYLLPWNGTGIKDRTGTNWTQAWNLEAANFAFDSSAGGGRGGYTYSASNQDATILGPGQDAWSGNKRQNVGGFGGRPLSYNGNNVLFMGGGGGSGDGNNNSAGDGGNGAGIVYLLAAGQVSGSGTVTANGQNGFNTQNSFIDAAGGGGGGGAIVVLSNTGISGISLIANGGNGGDQLVLSNEAEGPGGGGGGGYIASSHTGITRVVNAGANGQSYSAHVTEFLPNGATKGAPGTMASINYFSPQSCDESGFVLPVYILSFTAQAQQTEVLLNWTAREENNFSHYELERSTDGVSFQTLFVALGNEEAGKIARISHRDLPRTQAPYLYYRLKLVDRDGQVRYSEVRRVKWTSSQQQIRLRAYPNPASDLINIEVPAQWQSKTITMQLIDAAGRQVWTSKETASANLLRIPLLHQARGIYVLKLACGEEQAQLQVLKK
jgi:hypothetical protein